MYVEQRECNDGKLSGNFLYSSCVVEQVVTKADCTFDGKKILMDQQRLRINLSAPFDPHAMKF